MQRTSRHVFLLLLMPLLAIGLYLVLADGQQSLTVSQLVSILSTAGLGAFHDAVRYKEVTMFAAAVLLSVMTILRNPTAPHG
jgi:hypothetical protein